MAMALIIYLFLTLFVFLRIRRNLLDGLKSTINDCLSYLVDEKNNDKDFSISIEDELTRLQSKMYIFDKRIKENGC